MQHLWYGSFDGSKMRAKSGMVAGPPDASPTRVIIGLAITGFIE